MKAWVWIIVSFFLLTGLGTALAVPPGMELTWDNPMGTVTFSGKIHMEKGLQCTDCHTSIFQQKKGTAKITMATMNEGKFCGKCHNGDTAFSTKDPANCTTCHKQK
jgi:c(7)-type cytochrome triheme protein